MSGVVYGNMSRAELDAAYNNQAAHRDFAAQTAMWRSRSDALREECNPRSNLRYGERPRAVLDYYPGNAAEGPLLVFVHGGYWQGGSKESVGFLARGPLAVGFSVALIEYTIAPQAKIGDMIEEVGEALRWLRSHARQLGFDERRIVMAGHSAGAHLMCNLMGEVPLLGGVAISGIYDLEPIRYSYLNEQLGLNEQDVRSFSPILMPRTSSATLVVAVGADELDELIRQSRDFSRAWNAPLLELRGRDHFTILEELAGSDGQLCRALRQLAA
ncbi:Carboxylesterase NlhH [Pigmentiphaga humi]|uniref:Carboxylesterase NlhH n=1 Tax=Pigmentiphaga humi TaxID=2478468 RepID=A0A3P4B653_9BURK|nr:alpha/beta hydrolase [Pigmentiphaga humi]VCU70996.1 Carboxylesterase NlhH [Pigmentiphaga humi]